MNNVVRRHPATSALLHRRSKAEKEEEVEKEEEEEEEGNDKADGGDDNERRTKAVPISSSSSSSSTDPFDPQEPDPALTRAIESSFWEVEHLATRRHSAPPVAAAARAILTDPGLVPSLAASAKAAARLASAEADPRPAAAATYGSLIAEALAKRVKRAPLVAGVGINEEEGGEGLMLFGGGAWEKGWKRKGVVSFNGADAALAGEA